MSIGVGPVHLPRYLDRPQIITRTKGTDLKLAEFHHWAEPLADTFMRVVSENLSTLVPTDRVYLHPWGVGVDLDYKVLPSTTLSYDFTSNVNVGDSSDFSLDTTGGLSVSMSTRVALKVSLRFLYNNEPALEDVDQIAWLVLVDPDLIPGDGDEFFQTVEPDAPDAFEIEIGEDRARKTELDTVFRTSLVINF